ncbi:hypothetical protein R75461_07909 [Paraburkholderia nemoris]|nr:hypothetical protein R75461_07909 [Paraburkholderia nemoris]
MTATADAILLLDGSFLQRPILRSALDLVIYLHADKDKTNARGIARDRLRYGEGTDVTKLYEARYNPAFEMYEAECRPIQGADIVIDNTAFEAPELLRNSKGTERLS